MRAIKGAKRFLSNTNQSAQMALEIREGIANNHAVLKKILQTLEHQNSITNSSLGAVERASLINLQGFQAPPGDASNDVAGDSFEKAQQSAPLLFAPKTYNTSHPDYDVNVVRNFPETVMNAQNEVSNPVYRTLKSMMSDRKILDAQWDRILQQTLTEIKSIPHSEQVFQRIAYIEKYVIDLENQYGAFYRPGWVNLNDALFLYWTVRQLKPQVIAQAGVCNGLSAAFMVMALAKNGGEGKLHAVDLAPVFNSNDENWKVRGKVYGVTIPEGKTSGWIVPDAYSDRFSVVQGDAKIELPKLLEKLGRIDMFYHDSDHTYDHMMFEFTEAKKYLSKPGVIVSDDISWNASLWDFADQYKVPAYNYKGSVGIACF